MTETRIVRGPNATQTVVATGFQPGESVSATVNSTPFNLGPVVADAAGNARFTFAVGNTFALGQHRVDVRGSVTGELPSSSEQTAFVVVAVTTVGVLPATGSPVNGMLVGGVGAGMLLAGMLLWTLRRRSHTE